MRCTSLLLLLLVVVASAGCGYDVADPRAYPLKMVEVHRMVDVRNGFLWVGDLNADGIDELVAVTQLDRPIGGDGASIQNFDLRTMDQANVSGRIVRELLSFDMDGDGTSELVVPSVRNDSLFLSGFTYDGRRAVRAWHFFVISGGPRIEGDRVFQWDPEITHIERISVSPGKENILVMVRTEYAARPRGLLLFDPVTLALSDSLLVGAKHGQLVVTDLDDDGQTDIVVEASPSRNGGVAHGISDDYCWILHIELRPKLELVERQQGPEHPGFCRMGIATAARPLLFWVAISPRRNDVREPPVLELRERPARADPIRTVPMAGINFHLRPLDHGLDGNQDLLVSYPDGRYEIFDSNLDVVARDQLRGGGMISAVINHAGERGEPNYVARLVDGGDVLLDQQLKPLAWTPLHVMDSVMRNGPSGRARLVLATPDWSEITVASLEPQPFYLVYRHKRTLLSLILIPLSILALSTVLNVSRRQAALRRSLDSRNVAVLRYVPASGRLQADNATANGLLGGRRLSRSTLSSRWPELAATLARHEASVAWPQSFNVRMPGGSSEVVVVTILPDRSRHGLARARIVRIERLADHPAPDAKDAWRKLARRVVHDIRTPLSSIRLAAHRLKSVAEGVDGKDPDHSVEHYLEKIGDQVDRIDSDTAVFLSAVDDSGGTLETINASALLTELVEGIRAELPSDVTLNLAARDGLPDFVADRSDISSVITEVIRNSLSSMPNGGTITVRASAAAPPGLRGRRANRRPYVTIEVVDTGTGMSAESLSRVFESGYTTRAEGTGLGMTIAKRVVEGTGGLMIVSSEETVGTIVTVHLPGV